MGTFGRSNPLPLPWNGIQVFPPSVVLNKWPTLAGMKTAGSQLAAMGFVQLTAFETTALLDANQVSLESVPPRICGFGGAAKSLPKPIQIVPVPLPVTFGTWIPCSPGTTVLVNVPFALGFSYTRNEPVEVVLLRVTPP